MITKANSFQTSDGIPFAVLADAQKHELAKLLNMDPEDPAAGIDSIPNIVAVIVENSEKVIEILRATGRKPRERKKKPGRPKGSRSKSVVDKASGDIAATSNGESQT